MKKNNVKTIFIILIIVIVFFSVGVYAGYSISAKEISYTKPDGNVVSVWDALNELHEKSEDTTSPNDFTITISDVGYSEFTISGETTDDKAGIKGYTYIVTKSGIIEKKIENTKETTQTITGLDSGTTYNVYMIACDNSGNLKVSSIETVTTNTSCFVAGTKVLTETGLKSIEDIEIGENVYTINLDNNQKELKTVINVFSGTSDEIYELTIDNEVVKATPRHQFYIVDKGWVRAYDLSEGDQIVAKDNDSMKITKIEHKYLEKPVNIYNLYVEGNHNYFITQYEMLVHNAMSPTYVPNE